MKPLWIQKGNHVILPIFYNLNPVGYCYDECPSFDGKRCNILGHRPGTVCEPYAEWAIGQMFKLLMVCEKATTQLDSLTRALKEVVAGINSIDRETAP